MTQTTTLIATDGKLSRQQLTLVPTPPGTATHRPVPHHEMINALVETLGFRHIAVVRDEYAVSHDGMKMFGVLDLDTGMPGLQFSIGVRNAHDKSMRLGLTVGYRVFVCQNMAFSGDFEPIQAKHSKHFDLRNSLTIGVDQMQRNFAGMRAQVDRWQATQLTDVSVKMIIYRAFIESELEIPKHLARPVHELYFNPQVEEFPRTPTRRLVRHQPRHRQRDPHPHRRPAAIRGTDARIWPAGANPQPPRWRRELRDSTQDRRENRNLKFKEHFSK